MNIITINGKTYSVEGNKIVVRENKKSNKKSKKNTFSIQVGGQTIINDFNESSLTISFEGDLASLDCTMATINGNVRGDVDCTTLNCHGNIGGSVDGTTINCNDIQGNVDATTVKCKNVKGNINL